MENLLVDVISIGTLGRNRLWGESQQGRTEHSTCTLLRSGKQLLLVDPGLLSPAIEARLFERTGLSPAAITHVFLTSFDPAHRTGLAGFPNAAVLMHEPEIASARTRTDLTPGDAALLRRARPADEKPLPGVDLFPLAGPTPGHAGLLVSFPGQTLLIAGDAVVSRDHLLQGQVIPGVADLSAAQDAMREVFEIADIIIPGHDNLFMNPRFLLGR